MSKSLDDAHSWDRLARALRYVLHEFDLDLSQVGAQQRLRYEDFEAIFYHLFLVYDPNETKRRFRSICAARNNEERTKFIELTARYVNDRQLANQRVTTSQLRMLGGEPFRRLVANLIKAACDAKLERHPPDRSTGAAEDPEFAASGLSSIALRLRERSQEAQADMDRFKEMQDKLRKLRAELGQSNQEVRDKWRGLTQRNNCNLSLDDASNSTGDSQTRTCDTSAIVRALLVRLEVSHSDGKAALERIQAIEVPQEASNSESAVKKRLSQFIRETARKFNTSQELDSSAPGGEDVTKLNDQCKQLLIEYDQGLDRLSETWSHEEERLDEELLQDATKRARYEELEKLFPIMKLAPINGVHFNREPLENEGTPEPSLDFIREMLAMFPDDRYDDQEILEASKSLFT